MKQLRSRMFRAAGATKVTEVWERRFLFTAAVLVDFWCCARPDPPARLLLRPSPPLPALLLLRFRSRDATRQSRVAGRETAGERRCRGSGPCGY